MSRPDRSYVERRLAEIAPEPPPRYGVRVLRPRERVPVPMPVHVANVMRRCRVRAAKDAKRRRGAL